MLAIYECCQEVLLLRRSLDAGQVGSETFCMRRASAGPVSRSSSIVSTSSVRTAAASAASIARSSKGSCRSMPVLQAGGSASASRVTG